MPATTARTTTTPLTRVFAPRAKRYACPRCGARFVFEVLDQCRIPTHDHPTHEKLCAGGGELPVSPWKETLS